jgi:hypothetical protein
MIIQLQVTIRAECNQTLHSISHSRDDIILMGCAILVLIADKNAMSFEA